MATIATTRGGRRPVNTTRPGIMRSVNPRGLDFEREVGRFNATMPQPLAPFEPAKGPVMQGVGPGGGFPQPSGEAFGMPPGFREDALRGLPPPPGGGLANQANQQGAGQQVFGGFGQQRQTPFGGNPSTFGRGLMLGGIGGFAGNMQNAMGQLFAINQLNAERATENRRTDAMSRIFGQGQAMQFGMPNVALPSGGTTAPFQQVAPAAPEGMTGGAVSQFDDAMRAGTALGDTRVGLAGSEANAQQGLAARVADSNVMRQLLAMQVQQQGNQMGYNQGLQRLMAAMA